MVEEQVAVETAAAARVEAEMAAVATARVEAEMAAVAT